MGLSQRELIGPRIEALYRAEKQLLVGWDRWGGDVGDSVQHGVSVSGLLHEAEILRGEQRREAG